MTALMMVGCMDKGGQASGGFKSNDRQPLPTDTIYTQEAAMAIYDYDPVRALQIVDSAVIMGNLSDWQADESQQLFK